MRRSILMLLLAPIALGLLACYPSGPRWSTDSEAAREALEAGLDAEMKLYWDDAREHYAQAVKLDPGFLVAMERLAWQVGREERQRLAEEVRQADLSTVTEAEHFLLTYWLARMDQDEDAVAKILEERLRAAPDDPIALHQAALQARREGQLEEAEALNRRLIAVDPNWVYAQNMLGYLAMMGGNFQEAEERFKTYQYIAPDQANPHDSMGELLVLLGRYDEAERELDMALTVRPTFTASYENLLWIALFRQDADKAQTILERVEAQPGLYGHGAMPPESAEDQTEDQENDQDEDTPVETAPQESALLRHLTCLRDLHGGYLSGDWRQAWERSGPCMKEPGYVILGHQVLLSLGETAQAQATRITFQTNVEKALTSAGSKFNAFFQARFLHMDGNTLLTTGDAAAAAERFKQADALLVFDGVDHEAYFKLRNLGHLAAALATAGQDGKAAAAWRRVAEINPKIRPFLEAGLEPLITRGATRSTATAPPETTPPSETD